MGLEAPDVVPLAPGVFSSPSSGLMVQLDVPNVGVLMEDHDWSGGIRLSYMPASHCLDAAHFCDYLRSLSGCRRRPEEYVGHVRNQIVRVLAPRWLRVVLVVNVGDGSQLTCTAHHVSKLASLDSPVEFES